MCWWSDIIVPLESLDLKEILSYEEFHLRVWTGKLNVSIFPSLSLRSYYTLRYLVLHGSSLYLGYSYVSLRMHAHEKYDFWNLEFVLIDWFMNMCDWARFAYMSYEVMFKYIVAWNRCSYLIIRNLMKLHSCCVVKSLSLMLSWV